jgi:hypothetical protein
MGDISKLRYSRSAHLYIVNDVCGSVLRNEQERAGVADYRCSAQIIKRSAGKSSIAAAAYRSASRLVDERTGLIHDYTRKQGVTHAEVLTPEATPDWMHDRAQLWNTVEAVERRKDAQLAREFQLSLPHELNDDQRRDLVRGFVQEQFVGKGMIADLAIHAPSAEGDQRNHHAHVMLTMRTLTGDGFGNKARDWNSPDQLQEWREQWAHHQNRELERCGHPARVDHRSFESQGVDREPSQHLGPVANDMERNGKASRIGDENRDRLKSNSDRARDHAEAVELAHRIAREKERLGQWAEMKRRELDNAQDLSKLDLAQKHDRQKSNLEAQFEERHGTARATIKAELQAVEKRLSAKGVKKILRTVFGQTRADQTAQDSFTVTLGNIEQREIEERQALAKRQEVERRKEARRMAKNKDRLEKGVKTATERRQADGWKASSPRGSKRGTTRTGRPDRAKEAQSALPLPSQDKTPLRDVADALKGWFAKEADQPPTPKPKAPANDHAPTLKKKPKKTPKPAPEVKGSNEPDLATKKRTIDSVLDKYRANVSRPWDSATKSQDNDRRPWDSGLGRDNDEGGRERSPTSPKEPKR